MLRAVFFLACAFLGYVLPAVGTAQSVSEKRIQGYRLTGTDLPPVIDGVPDDEIWRRADWRDDFLQIVPSEFAPASQRTSVAVVYDDKNLYIAAILLDNEPEKILARQWIQGRAFDMDDQFHILLDTFRNRRTGYFFQVNPNGVRREALIDNVLLYNDWQTIWLSAAQRSDDGWSVEMMIPFASLNFDPGAVEWGINFGRVIRRSNEEIAWSSLGADARIMIPAAAGILEGLEAPSGNLGVDVQVSGIPRYERIGGNADVSARPSADIFYKPSSSMTLAATLNTDFSEVDIDDRIVNLTRFSVSLPEKRDFFLHDMNIFEYEGLDVNGRPFFSRSIGLDDSGVPVDIMGGLKTTGRMGRLGYGLLGLRQKSVTGERFADLAVTRVTADVLSESRIGAITTHGSPEGNRANVYGFDAAYRKSGIYANHHLRARAWYTQSRTGDIRGNDHALGWGVGWSGDVVNVNFTRQDIGAHFNPPLGFVNRSNIRQSMLRAGYRHRFKQGPVRSLEPWLIFNNIDNLDDGRLATRWLRVWPFSLHWHSGDLIEYWRDERIEVLVSDFRVLPGFTISPGRYYFSDNGVALVSSPHRILSGSLTYEFGGFYNGSRRATTGSLQVRPWSKLTLSAFAEISDISSQNEKFSVYVLRFQSEAAISPIVSWSAVVMYDNVSTVMSMNSRLRWWPHAGRRLDVVVGRNIDEQRGFPNRINDTVFVIKYSHTFRF
jgi:hypothetical protein